MRILICTGYSSPITKSFMNFLRNDQLYDKYDQIFLTSRKIDDTTTKNDDKENLIQIDFDTLLSIPFIESKTIDVFHAASAVPAKYSLKEKFVKINCENPIKFFKSLKYEKINIFYLSSTSVYDKFSPGTIFENSAKTTKDHYGISKLLFEQNVCSLKNSKTLGLRVPVLLTKNVQNNFMSSLKKNLKSGNLIKVAFLDHKFNAITSDKDIIRIFKNFLEGKNMLLQDHNVLNIASKSPILFKNLLIESNITEFEEVTYDIPPRLISIDDLQKYFPNVVSNTLDNFKEYLND